MRSKKRSKKNRKNILDISVISSTYNSLYSKYSKMTIKQRDEIRKEINSKPRDRREIIMQNFITFCVTNNVSIKRRELKKHLSSVKEYINNENKSCLKDYVYEKDLGQGSYGKVVLVSKGKQKYAIKIIKLDTYNSEGYMNYATIKNEINLYKSMGKLGISPKLQDSFYCLEKNNFNLYIVLEYMTEGSLEDWKHKKKKLPEYLKKQLKSKLNLLHKHDIYHLDIAERNILLSNKNGKLEIFIGDFGESLSKEQILKGVGDRNDADLYNILSYENTENLNDLVIKSMVYLHSLKI